MLPRTIPDLASVVVSGRQEGVIIFNFKWKCNQKIMKVSQVCMNQSAFQSCVVGAFV